MITACAQSQMQEIWGSFGSVDFVDGHLHSSTGNENGVGISVCYEVGSLVVLPGTCPNLK